MTLYDDLEKRIESIEQKQISQEERLDDLAHATFWNKKEVEGMRRYLILKTFSPEELIEYEIKMAEEGRTLRQPRDYRG